ncbi:hypothetical protein, partial [Flavobacterium aquidurense]|uniref:hypothetical protein n=1 Tax=Flavobacterium aquidurense TaxID=362413 RepID=UPI001A96E219
CPDGRIAVESLIMKLFQKYRPQLSSYLSWQHYHNIFDNISYYNDFKVKNVITLNQHKSKDMTIKLTDLILKALAENFNSSVSLEELAEIAGPYTFLIDKLADERPDEQVLQSIILENLILLHDQGMVLLDEMTDRSTITPKGLKAAALKELQ